MADFAGVMIAEPPALSIGDIRELYNEDGLQPQT